MRGPDGVEFPVDATYLEVDAPARLVIESKAVGPDGTALLEATNTVTFVERDGKTEVTVHARATALVPEAAPMLVGMEVGWNQSLQCLDDVLTGAVDRQFVIMRVFDAPREVLFRAWTDPAQLLAWWGPKGFSLTIEEIDVRPGGTWRFTMHGPDGVDYPNVARYEIVEAPRRLVFMLSGEEVTAEVRRSARPSPSMTWATRRCSRCARCSRRWRLGTSSRRSTTPSRAATRRWTGWERTSTRGEGGGG